MGTRRARHGAVLFLLAVLAACWCAASLGDSVYRWVDADGVIHISSEKPPPGVQAERISVASSSGNRRGSSSSPPRSGSATGSPARPAATAGQVAEREQVLGSLRTRECVIALEALDRLTSGSQPTSAAELRRLQQTADLNCSKDPARRREEEDMAAKLRVANGPACVEARNQLAAMLAAGATTSRAQLKAQQEFVDTHCTAPVR